MTQSRIEELVKSLGLKPHPEGGFYSEIYRSPENLATPAGDRNLASAIYFLLRSADVSRFHRIKSDELWFWHEGSPISIHILGAKGRETLMLGPIDERGTAPQQLVKANSIFGSTLDHSDSYALVSCVVAPGFDFADFELFKAEDLLSRFPDSADIIRRLT